ncbi:MAG TPA: cytochrome ubiquinol oxidase subunit I [Devosiaceae bacterium]|nr:cytochrome ubiquinol oxidase subunit I [Devosiaceae bacterium]
MSSENDLSNLLPRLDFAWITTLHIVYPPLTIGLAVILFYAEWRWMRTNDEKWYRLCRFFERLFIVNFGAGVATGVTMEMAFGILYGRFSQAAGPFFGQVLGYETITAFMYEAGFLGLMVFGWGKIGKRMHLFATFNVALASCLSVFWILDANSWMQSPNGVVFRNGYFEVTNWVAAILNPNFFSAFPHMLIACFELSVCFVAAVSAWYLLKQRHVELFQRALKYSVGALLVIAPVQIYLGDAVGQDVGKLQPASLAAMEGHYHTTLPDGQSNTGWHILAWPNSTGDGNAWAITIPHALSVIETHTWNAPVTGLDDIPAQDRPPVAIPFYSFRVMAGIGGFLLLVALWGTWLAATGRLSIRRVASNKWFLRAVVLSGFLPYIAVWTGWWTREIGRQPWLVYGMMRTSEGVSHMSVFEGVFWLLGFVVFELAVLTGSFYYLCVIVKRGPDLTRPLPGEEHEPTEVEAEALLRRTATPAAPQLV